MNVLNFQQQENGFAFLVNFSTKFEDEAGWIAEIIRVMATNTFGKELWFDDNDIRELLGEKVIKSITDYKITFAVSANEEDGKLMFGAKWELDKKAIDK
jgi:hypothetical protein